MSDRPIRRDRPTEMERLLLRSAGTDSPPRSSKGRTLSALGLAAAATTTASAGGAAASGLVAAGLVKWVAVGALGGVVAIGAVAASRPSADPTPPTRVTATPTQTSTSTPTPTQTSTPTPTPTPTQTPTQTPTPTPTPTSTPPRPAPPPPPLFAEVSSLDAVRRSLAAGDPASALRLLDLHDSEFPQPALAPEASLLRLEVMIGLGKFDDARRLGNRLLGEQPDSAYAQRVRSLLGETFLPRP